MAGDSNRAGSDSAFGSNNNNNIGEKISSSSATDIVASTSNASVDEENPEDFEIFEADDDFEDIDNEGAVDNDSDRDGDGDMLGLSQPVATSNDNTNRSIPNSAEIVSNDHNKSSNNGSSAAFSGEDLEAFFQLSGSESESDGDEDKNDDESDNMEGWDIDAAADDAGIVVQQTQEDGLQDDEGDVGLEMDLAD